MAPPTLLDQIRDAPGIIELLGRFDPLRDRAAAVIILRVLIPQSRVTFEQHQYCCRLPGVRKVFRGVSVNEAIMLAALATLPVEQQAA
jgi:hypothetical protein